MLEKLNKLNEEKIKNLENRMEIIDPNKSEITFKFRLNNISEFLKSKKRIDSETFYCRNLPFALTIYPSKKSEPKNYIQLFLRCENNLALDMNYSIKADYELRLLSKSSNVEDLVYRSNKVIFKNGNF